MRRFTLIGWLPRGTLTLFLATVLLWLLNYAITTGWSLSQTSVAHQWALAQRRLVMCGFGMLFTLAGYAGLRRTAHLPVTVQALIGVCGALIASVIHVAVHLYVFYHFNAPWGGKMEAPYWVMGLNIGSMIAWVYVTSVAAYLAITYGEQVRERDARLIQVEALAVDAQNRMLRYQINPHFLFNALNALSTQVMQGRNQAAEAMILSISQFLRRSLMSDIATKVTLGEELAAEMQYLSIERVRFGERMTVVQAVSDDARSALIPSFILQPLVENAVKHGVAETSAPVTLRIEAEAAGERLHILVADDGAGPSRQVSTAAGFGVGLANVRRRLDVLYAGRAGVVWGAVEGGGFEVRLDLPMEYS